MKERLIAYGRFDCENDKGYVEMLAFIEYEDILIQDDKGEFIENGERQYGCYDCLDNSGLQKGNYFRNLSALINDSITCYGKYRGFRIYEVSRQIRKDM